MSKLPHEELINISSDDATKIYELINIAAPIYKKEVKAKFFQAIITSNWEEVDNIFNEAVRLNIINEVDALGNTALHLCSLLGANNIVKKLLPIMDYNVAYMPNFKDIQTAGHLALLNNHSEVFEQLLDFFKIDYFAIRNKSGFNCLHLAVAVNDIDSTTCLVSKSIGENYLYLLTSSLEIDTKIVTPLAMVYKKCFDDNRWFKVFDQLTVFAPKVTGIDYSEIYFEKLKSDFYDLIIHKDYEKAKYVMPQIKKLGILELSIDINQNTLLQTCLMLDHHPIVSELIINMSLMSIRHKNVYGETAALLAIEANLEDIAELLIPRTKTSVLMNFGSDNLNCLKIAMRKGYFKIIELLVNKCFEEQAIDLLIIPMQLEQQIKMLIEYAAEHQFYSQIMENIFLKLVNSLPDYINNYLKYHQINDLTKLAIIAELETKVLNKEYDSSIKLVPALANLDILDFKDVNGDTILIRCCRAQHLPIIKPLILAMNVDSISITNHEGYSAVSYAIIKGIDSDITELLIQKSNIQCLMSSNTLISNCLTLALQKENYGLAMHIINLPDFDFSLFYDIDLKTKTSPNDFLVEKFLNEGNEELSLFLYAIQEVKSSYHNNELPSSMENDLLGMASNLDNLSIN